MTVRSRSTTSTTDPLVAALRDELAALRAHLQRVERQAQHDYEALNSAFRETAAQQLAATIGYVTATPTVRGTLDLDCPF